MASIAVGDRAPDFTLPSQSGARVICSLLIDRAGGRWVLRGCDGISLWSRTADGERDLDSHNERDATSEESKN